MGYNPDNQSINPNHISDKEIESDNITMDKIEDKFKDFS